MEIGLGRIGSMLKIRYTHERYFLKRISMSYCLHYKNAEEKSRPVTC